MSHLSRAAWVWAVAMSAPLSLAAQELVTNGDFSQGNTGFTSAYAYYYPYTSASACHQADSRGNLMKQSCYAITSDPYLVHVGGYHGLLGSQGNVMVVNGSKLPAVWMQTVQISAGHVYRWSAKAASNVTNANNGFNGDPAPAKLALQLANSPGACTTAATGFETIATIVTTSYGLSRVGNLFTAPNWVSAQGTTTRAQDGQYCLRIYDTVGVDSGNDFLMDDLSFLDVTPVPTPVAVPSLGAIGLLTLSGALGWMGLRRRRTMGAGVR